MKSYFTLIIIILLAVTSGVSPLSAENETEVLINESERIGETVRSEEDGYLNISFDDGYNGYCINKGWLGAVQGDTFTVENTSTAINNNNKESIGNYLKIFFTEKYDIISNDEKATQNVIWAFSNNHYRPEYASIVDEVRSIGDSGLTVPDHGATIKINNTTEAIFDFEVLNSGYNGYQNFFGYKITYKDIIEEIFNNTIMEVPENDTIVNETVHENNTTIPETNENKTEEKPNNNTTIPETNENKTEEKPENNITNKTTEENNTIEIPTIPKTEEKPENNTENETITEQKPENNTTNETIEIQKIEENSTVKETIIKEQTKINETDENTVNKEDQNNTPKEENSVDLLRETGNPVLIVLLVLIAVIGFRRE